MKRIYIAGPYTKGDVAVNVRTAMLAGVAIIHAGHAPFIPHLYHFLHLLEPQPYDTWTAQDFAWLPYCDALLRLEGESSGADAEVDQAIRCKVPIYTDLDVMLSELK